MKRIDISDFFIEKLVLPKTYVLDMPGRVISKTFSKFGRLSNQKRLVYIFEDILAGLQLSTISQLGFEHASKLYFEIGRKMGIRLMLISKINAAPPDFILKKVLTDIFKVYSSIGVNKDIYVRVDKRMIQAIGHDTAICRKTGLVSMYSGIIVGMLGVLSKKELEVSEKDTYCNGKETKITILRKNASLSDCDYSNLGELNDYDILNFGNPQRHIANTNSITDLIMFRKLVFEDGKPIFMNKTILPFEIGLLGIISDSYEREGHSELLAESVTKTSEKLCMDLIRNIEEKPLIFVEKLTSVLGFGINYISCSGKKIRVKSVEFPHSRYPPLIYLYFLNGLLNAAVMRKLRVEKHYYSSGSLDFNVVYS